MLFSTLVSYTAGLGIAALGRPAAPKALPGRPDHGRPRCCSGSSSTRTSGSTRSRRRRALARQPTCTVPHLNIILPIGISFYTFHTITYIVDSYRGVIKPTRNFFEFAAYVSLFSQLVAGPIVRFRQIEEDLENLGHADRTRWLRRGISFFVIGLVEKVLIADTLAAFVDPALANYADALHGGRLAGRCSATPSSSTSTSPATARWRSASATCSGSAFRRTSTRRTRRSTRRTSGGAGTSRCRPCLRDYLYIPLGGNRGGDLRDVPQPDADDADRRPVARRGVDLRLLGGLSRRAAGASPGHGRALGQAARAVPPAAPCSSRPSSAGCSSARRASTWRLQLLRKMFTPTAGRARAGPAARAARRRDRRALGDARAERVRAEARLALARPPGARLGIRRVRSPSIVGNRPSPFLYFQF